ncbi:MAG: hypothetical protein SVU32_07265 [Candidatus Nanohaloarchaea archaeon]|nr:hypothetical protein [Candidatus Nanohaloarchaea archaeon]
MESYAMVFDPPIFIAGTILLLAVFAAEEDASWRRHLQRLAGASLALMVAFIIYSRYGQVQPAAQWLRISLPPQGLSLV